MNRRKQRLCLVYISARLGRVLALFAFLGLLFGLNTRAALAHGAATLVVNPTATAPGGTIEVTAEGVEAGEEFTLTLEGINVQITVGTVTVEDGELFRQDFSVPLDVPSGSYYLVATSGEGERLTAELAVEAGTVDSERTAQADPSAEPMQLDRSKSPMELTVIIAGLVVSAGLGLMMVWVREK